MIPLLEMPPSSSRRGRGLSVVEVVTAIGWILVTLAIGSSFVGHSKGPYGACYAPSGRSVPCEAVVRR